MIFNAEALEKKCSKCKELKSFTEFYRNSSRADGLCSRCKQCDRNYQATRKDESRSYSKAWRQEFPEKVRQYSERYRLEHTDEMKAYSKLWRSLNPDKVRDSTVQHRARKKNAEVEKVERLVVFERDGWVCQICLLPVERDTPWPDSMSPSLDHTFPLSRGGEHSYANTRLTHLVCNLKKSAKVPITA